MKYEIVTSIFKRGQDGHIDQEVHLQVDIKDENGDIIECARATAAGYQAHKKVIAMGNIQKVLNNILTSTGKYHTLGSVWTENRYENPDRKNDVKTLTKIHDASEWDWRERRTY